MKIVIEEKVIREKIGLIELDCYFKGRRLYLRVDPDTDESLAIHLRKTANCVFKHFVEHRIQL